MACKITDDRCDAFRGLTYPGRLFLLYWSFFKITALVIGGGLAMLPVIEDVFVTRYKCLTKDELLDMVTLTQTMPGIIAMNSAVYVGMKVGGIFGALAAVFGAFTPPFFVILIIAIFFPHLNPDNKYIAGAFAGVRACIAGLILMTAYKLFRNVVKCWFEACVVLTFFVLALCKISPIYLILSAMPFGCIYLWILQRRMKHAELQQQVPKEEHDAR